MKRWFVTLTLVIAGAGCAAPLVHAVGPPSLGRIQAERLAMRADDALRSAMSGTSMSELAAIFRGPAKATLQLQAARLAQHGLRIEERDVVRKLVFLDAHAPEAVLAVTARHRLVSPDDPNPAWAATARQWWVRFEFESGEWWVVDQRDLAPDRWFTVS